VSRKRRQPKGCPSSCTRKTGYGTEAEAKRHAEALAVAMPYQVTRTYRCKSCRLWFVTCEPRRVKRK
jgi:tRNA(Arg) A34 adenosine deaminase TadA